MIICKLIIFSKFTPVKIVIIISPTSSFKEFCILAYVFMSISISIRFIIIGQAPDIKNDYIKYNRRMIETHNNMDLIKYSTNFLTPKQYEKTIAYKIMNTEPYNNYPIHNWKLLGTDISYLDNMKSTIELLNFFYDKYGIDKYEKNDNNILITID